MDDVKGLVPEIYYDMIARIAAGVPFVAILISPNLSEIERVSNFKSFALVFGLGYIAGHLLATVSVVVNQVLWNPVLLQLTLRLANLKHGFKSHWPLRVLDESYERVDNAARVDKSAGAIMKKMEAGAALSDNLLSGWIIILICRELSGNVSWLSGLGSWRSIEIISITLLLVISVYVRRAAFIVRQDRLISQLPTNQGAL